MLPVQHVRGPTDTYRPHPLKKKVHHRSKEADDIKDRRRQGTVGDLRGVQGGSPPRPGNGLLPRFGTLRTMSNYE